MVMQIVEEGVRFCFRQSLIHKDYLFWLYKFFLVRGYCSNLEPRKYTRASANFVRDWKEKFIMVMNLILILSGA